MESREAGRPPDVASSSSGGGGGGGNGNPAVLLVTSNGNRQLAALVTTTRIHGKSAPVSTNGAISCDLELEAYRIGNLALVSPSTAAAVGKQVQEQQFKSGWSPKALSFLPYVHRSVHPTGRLANGALTGTKKQANGFRVEESQKIKDVMRNSPLVVNKLTKDVVETYSVCNPDFEKSSAQAPTIYLPTRSEVVKSIVENNIAELQVDHPKRNLTIPSEKVSNNGTEREIVENDLNVPKADLLTNHSAEVGREGQDHVEHDLTNTSKGVSKDPELGNVENNPSVLQVDPPKRYLTNPSEGVSNDGRDNVDHDLILQVDDVLFNSASNVTYAVKDILGKGSFGQVFKCRTSNPKRTREHVAVKIIKNREDFHDSANSEQRICKTLNIRDPFDKHNIVRILDSFVFAGHLCLVFELMSINLHELSRLNGCAGLSIKAVRRLTLQILEALIALEAAGVMHCDLKPENIVLHPDPLEKFTAIILAHLEAKRNAGDAHPDLTEKDIILNTVFLERYARIKLIDFGLASVIKKFSAGIRNTYIQSRHYRSPEVVLKIAYTPAMDMWSLGCVAAELFLGIPLFPGANEYDLFRFMVDILGRQPPDDMICASGDEIRGRFFKLACAPPSPDRQTPGGRPIFPTFALLSEAEIEARVRAYGLGKPPAEKRYFGSKTLEDIIMEKKSRGKRMSEKEMTEEISSRAAFLDFLMGVLHFDPRKRWTPKQARMHPFLTGEQFVGRFSPSPDPSYVGQARNHGAPQ